jgi:hypothetical protein
LDAFLVADDFQWVAGAMVFSPSGLIDVASRTHFYRPVIEIYFAAEHVLFSCSADALHLLNLLIHLANAALAMVLAFRLTGRVSFAVIGGLLFSVQPAPVEAVAWPSAATVLICVFFSLTALLIDASRRAKPGAVKTVAFTLCFAAALGAHESAVVLLPVALLLRYADGGAGLNFRMLRDYRACFPILLAYLALTAWINSRNYVVTEGHYQLGPHVLSNLANYLVALPVARRLPLDYAVAVAITAALLWKGTPQVRAWTGWMLIALGPVLPFEWGTSSRYLYPASIPFAWLVAAGILAIGRAGEWWRAASRRAAVSGLVAMLVILVIVRSATFARKNAETFRSGAAQYEALSKAIAAGGAEARVIALAADRSIDPLYVPAMARVAACRPDVAAM